MHSKLVITALLFLLAGCLYTWTFSGIYFHDGAAFLQQVESGNLFHYHLAYQPVACALAACVSPLGGSVEWVMGALSVVCGAGVVAGVFWLLAEAAPRWLASLVALLVMVTPAIWFGATLIEIHVFAAFMATVGLVVARRVRPTYGPALGTGLAMLGHMSGVVLAPTYRADAVMRDDKRTWRRGLQASGWLVLVVLIIRFVSETHPASPSRNAPGLEGVFRAIDRELARPDLYTQVWVQLGVLWAALIPLGLFGLRRKTLVAALSVTIIFALDYLAVGRMLAQYSTIAVPFVAILVGSGLVRLAGSKLGIAAVVVIAVAHVASAVPKSLELLRNEDGQWAERMQRGLELPNRIMANGRNRRRLLQSHGLAAHNFSNVPAHFEATGPAGFEAWLRTQLSSSTHVYIDPGVFRDEETPLTPFLEVMESGPFHLRRLEDLGLFEISYAPSSEAPDAPR